MKLIIILGLLFSLVSCQSPQQKSIDFEYYQNDTILKLLKTVVRTDSIKTTCYLTFKSFDKRDSLVTELNYYQCQNNSKDEYLNRRVYDRQGKLVLHQKFNMEGLELEKELY